jgi:uncharacterized protein
MYLVPVKIKASPIDGKGVFTVDAIKAGTIVWLFTSGHDLTLSEEQYKNKSFKEKAYLTKVAYLSATSRQYIYPPVDDPAIYTNHDAINHNLSARTDIAISPEPFFVANRDIMADEEITNNYNEFDQKLTEYSNLPDWL